uniref:Beta-D-glucosyl crocetin beta-1,6-glucosyltransferase-like n=1 Tax=Nicotiana tabacum TaxID=4097 RepID=A0A1S3ZLL1_TOBAC|nr:PREDICTED: beta-D-glucosyl crocetin beta-1,6-glucosyltransferase-like [Nicotiana tabacum]
MTNDEAGDVELIDWLGFISHCGWNSVMKSVDFGGPIIAMPMHLDQPVNARLMVELGVTLEIVRVDDDKIRREKIAQVVKGVIASLRGRIENRFNIDRARARRQNTRLEDLSD